MNFNKVIILGNLTQDPITRATPNGQNVTSFSVATNRFWRNKQTGEKQQQVEFHNVVCWQKLAEIAQQFLKKGNLVFVEGRLQTRTWQDKEGNKKYRTEIVAETLQLPPRQSGAPMPNTQRKESAQPTEEIESVPIPEDGENSGNDINPDDIPF